MRRNFISVNTKCRTSHNYCTRLFRRSFDHIKIPNHSHFKYETKKRSEFSELSYEISPLSLLAKLKLKITLTIQFNSFLCWKNFSLQQIKYTKNFEACQTDTGNLMKEKVLDLHALCGCDLCHSCFCSQVAKIISVVFLKRNRGKYILRLNLLTKDNFAG